MATGGALRFASMFEAAPPVGSPPRCPGGYSSVNTPNAVYGYEGAEGREYYIECLKVRGVCVVVNVCDCVVWRVVDGGGEGAEGRECYIECLKV